jgi:hypothetical protein
MPPTLLEEKIAKTEAALRKEDDPVRYTALATRLSTLQAAKKEMDDEDDEDEEDEEKKSKKSKKSEEKASASKKSEEEEEEEESKSKKSKKSEEKKSEEEEEEESAKKSEEKAAKAALALIETRTGRKGGAALGAAAALFGRLDQVEADTAALKAKSENDERKSLLESITRHGAHRGMVSWLAGQDLDTIRGFASEALKQPKAVHTEEGDLLIPKVGAEANSFAALSKDEQAIVSGAEAALPSSFTKEQREAFRAETVKQINAAKSKQMNGAGGVY